jgi:DNA polymerase
MATNLFIDFETYYGTGYSLKVNKYNNTSYIHDEQFLIHCAHLIYNGRHYAFATDYDAPDPYHHMRAFFKYLHWDEINMVAHQILFDGYIMYKIFGIQAATYTCTIAMSRAVFQDEIQHGLKFVAPRLGFGDKLIGELEKVRGMRRVERQDRVDLMKYCRVDTELCRDIYYALDSYFSEHEMTLLHITYDCFFKPVLELDLPRIEAEQARQEQRRADAVAATGYAASNFSSAAKYKTLLENKQVKVPLKWSEKKEAFIPALAKDDLAYIQLQAYWIEKERTNLTAFAKARELCASSIHITRPQRMIDAASFNGKLPIAYNYFGALNTGRWSGANKLNAQNLPRIDKADPLSGQCRLSIIAPQGYVICVQDLKAIELCVSMFYAKQADVLADIVAGEDQYCGLASDVYGKPVDKSMKIERMVGKTGILGLGYGMGAPKYQHTLAIGQFGPSVIIDPALAQLTVRTYRHKHDKVVDAWTGVGLALEKMTEVGCNHTWGDLSFRHERVVLPSGRYLYYPGLHFSEEGELMYWSARYKGWTKIYGAKFWENIIQAIARDVLGEHMTKVHKYVGKVVMHTHDELVTIAPEEEGQARCDAMAEVMRIPPTWAQGLPLDVDGGFARAYSK